MATAKKETQEQIEAPVAFEHIAKHENLMKAMHAARSQMGPVPMSGHNKYDNYDYSTMGDYLDTIRGPLEQNGLFLLAEEEGEPDFFQTTSGKMPCGCRLKMRLKLVHIDSGESLEHISRGEGWDRGDKALYKAKTGARKYGIQCLFNLYGDDDPEKDSVPTDDAPNQHRQQQMLNGDPLPSEGSSGPGSVPGRKAAAPLTLEMLETSIKQQATPADLLTLVNKAAAGENLPKDLPLFRKFIERCGKYIEAKIQSNAWEEDATLEIDQRLSELFLETEPKQQKELA